MHRLFFLNQNYIADSVLTLSYDRYLHPEIDQTTIYFGTDNRKHNLLDVYREFDISTLENKRDKAQIKKTDAEIFLGEMEKDLKAAKTAHKKLPSDADQQALRDLFDETSALAELSEEISNEIEELSEEIEELRELINRDELTLQARNTEIEQKRSRAEVLEPVATSMGTIKAVIDADVILKSTVEFVNQIEHAESQAEQAEASSSQAEKQFQSTLKTEKFTSVTEARSAYLDDDAITALSTSIEDYESRAKRILVLSGTIGDTAPPKVRPDLEQLTKNEQEASLAREASSTSMTKTSTAISSLEKVQFDIKGGDVCVAQLFTKYRGLKHIKTKDPSKIGTFQIPNCVQLTKYRKNMT
jgi:DNA repair exonuclease SbcCD ATPase subunit